MLGMSACGALICFGSPASATVVHAVSLPALVKSSRRIAVVRALASECHFEEIGRRRRIVTDTRVRVEELVAKGEGMAVELLVRTLGGSVGELGERVQGQAMLATGEPCVAFLLEGPDGIHYVNGMAQGHYPLRGTATRKLVQSPDLADIVDMNSSAVKQLVGVSLGEASDRIRSMVAP